MTSNIVLSQEAATAAVRVAAVIERGGVAAIPTDTVYGLVCDARNESAIRRMCAMKERPEEKAFPVFVKDIAMARRFAYISDEKAEFLERVWPGVVTVVFPHKEKLPAVLTGGKDTLGVRMPDHPFLSALLGRLDFPLAQTSVNISDMPPARNANEILRYFKDAGSQPDVIVDAGEVSGAPSTVVDCTGASPLILRSGIVSKADIDRMLGTP